jgi:hypothetical protein
MSAFGDKADITSNLKLGHLFNSEHRHISNSTIMSWAHPMRECNGKRGTFVFAHTNK